MDCGMINYLSVLATYSLVITGLMIVIKAYNKQSKWESLFFITCVALYMMIDFVPRGIIFYILVAGPFLVPFSFWVLSRSLFSDSTISSKWIIVFAASALILYYLLYYLSENENCDCSELTMLLFQSLSLIFVLFAIFEAQRGRSIDLMEKRRGFRSFFTYSVSVIVLLTLLAELALDNTNQNIPKLLQRSVVIIFSTYFLIRNITWTDIFLEKTSRAPNVLFQGIIDKIQAKMSEERIYRTEAITIGQLAELVNEQEYKVREAINLQLGYQNFSEFINSFRIGEAKEILSDPSQQRTTILEVAYQIGYNSIGPFNRAFKSFTGQTPTEFRKHVIK